MDGKNCIGCKYCKMVKMQHSKGNTNDCTNEKMKHLTIEQLIQGMNSTTCIMYEK